LEEDLLVRRNGLKILVPDPQRLLLRWADKYRERWKWDRRSAWTSNNPFGYDINIIWKNLRAQYKSLAMLVTGTAAANLTTPYTEVEKVDVFVLKSGINSPTPRFDNNSINKINTRGPDFLFIYPYDSGVIMYSKKVKNVTVTSDVQVFLDCYAKGGRDAKQADYILTEVLENKWKNEK